MIIPGTILTAGGTLLPESLRLENEPYSSTWMSVKSSLDPRELEKQLKSAGWTFFYMAGQLSTSVFGFDREKIVEAALKRMITKVRLQKCNSFEIDEMAMHSFLGVPYVSVLAHPRHIQKGLVFSGQ